MKKVKILAEIKWIKITTDMFDNRKIKHLRRLPDGNNIVLIWVMLLTMAGRCNSSGMIFLTENIPYTPKMLADELDFEENTVQLALTALEQLNMIVTDQGFFTIAGWDEYQNIEGMDKIREQNRIRQAKFKARQKQLSGNVTDNVTVTQGNGTDKEEDKEKNKKEKKEPKDPDADLLKVAEILGKYDYSLFEEHVPELQQAIISFMEFRKSIKKPMTDHAVDLMVKKLKDMTFDVSEQVEIINQSIVNGWQGIFPLKEKTGVKGFNNTKQQAQTAKQSEHDAFMAQLAAMRE